MYMCVTSQHQKSIVRLIDSRQMGIGDVKNVAITWAFLARDFLVSLSSVFEETCPDAGTM